MLLGFWHKTPCMQPPKLSGTRVSYLLLLKSSLSLHYFTKRMILPIKSNPFGFLAANYHATLKHYCHKTPFMQMLPLRGTWVSYLLLSSLSLHSFEEWMISTKSNS